MTDDQRNLSAQPLSTAELGGIVRKAVSVSMMQTGEKWVDRDGNPAAIWTHDEYDEAMWALNELLIRANEAAR